MHKTREVNRCVCHRRSFEELKEYAEKQNIDTAEELVEQRLCGCGCGLCIPYVKKMLRTGKSSFNPSAMDKNDRPV